jgi:endonuclease/exonuclease/phosphatase family metal-dependent hydrolase
MSSRALIIPGAYATLLVTWLIVRAASGDSTLFVLGFNYLGVWLFAPLLFFIPWVLNKRSKWGGLLLAIPISLFLWFYGVMFIPKLGIENEEKAPFNILTFNVQESNSNTNALLEIIASSPAEVIALQEVSPSLNELLGESLKSEYPHQIFNRPGHLAVFSQFPIDDYRLHLTQPWPFQSMVLTIHGDPVHLINAHLAKPGLLLFLERGDFSEIKELASARKEQVERILGVTGSKELPTVLACDCNMTSLTATYSQLTHQLQDAYLRRGWGFGNTFLIPRGFDINSNINFPFQRIDYLFYSPELSVLSVSVISKESGSDHRPLLAQFGTRE